MAKDDIIKTRWETDDGKDRLERIVKAIQKGDDNWPEILEGFPEVEKLENMYDLRGVDLSGYNLNGVTLCNVCFANANLSRTILNHANLASASLSQANLDSASLIKTTLTQGNLPHASFKNANLKKADLSRTKLDNARFTGANIKGTRFRYASFGSFAVVNGWGLGSSHPNVDFAGVKYNRRTSFLGTNIANNNWANNPLLKRHIEDQQWLDVWRNKSWFNKYIFYPIWLISCDCGRNFLLWACWSLVLAIGFGFIFSLNATGLNLTTDNYKTLADAHWFMPFYYSIVTFTTLGFGDIVPRFDNGLMQFWVTCEVIVGYIMLGGLISILANKIARRA